MRPLVVSALAVGLSCSGGFRPQDYPTPESLMAFSEARFREGDCGDAEEGFREVTFRMPGRDAMANRARFLMAECQYLAGQFLEAARQFRRVADEAPGTPLAPNALLRAGDAQMELWKHPDLDPTYGEAAVATFRDLVARYPGTTAARRAGLRVLELNTRFAQREYNIGAFYQRIKAFDSAVIYYKNLVALYPETTFAPLALLRLVEIYTRIAYDEERKEICDHLRSYYATAAGLEERCPIEASP